MNPNTYSNRTAQLFTRWMASALVAMAILTAAVADAQNVSVSATAGTASGSYATVSAAFAAINAGTHQGAVTLRIIANTTEPAAPTALTKSGPTSNYTSVRIEPFGGNYTISGAAVPTSNRAIIELNGADNVTIDGDDPTVVGKRNLTIGFPSAVATTITSCIKVSSNSTVGADGATNNTIINCNIVGSRTSTGTNATYGINMSNYSTTGSATGGYSSINNRFENNLITRCYHGIWAVGASSTYPNTGLRIVNNVLGDNTAAGNIGLRAIIMSNSAVNEAQSAIISGNQILGVGDPGTTGYAASVAGIEVGTSAFGTKIFNNLVQNVKQPSASGYGSYGVLFSGASSCDSMRFYNNIVQGITASNFTATALSSFTNYGVRHSAGAAFADFSNNTIVLNVANPTGTTANSISYALAATVNGVLYTNFRNNIIVNSVASTNAVGIYVNSAAIYTASNYPNGRTWDKNCYWVPSGILGFSASGTPQSTLSAWRTATGVDASSYNVLPNFVSATDMHIDGSIASLLESGGMATSFTTDYDGDARPGPAGSVNGGAAFFDVGADEFDGVRITPVSITSATATPSSCTAVPHTVTATVVAGSNPITSVTLTYTLNGTAQTPISMTNTSGNTWEASIPAAVPTNANIAWTVTAVDPVASPTATGSYQDDALNGIGLTATATPSSVCTGSSTSLAVGPYNPNAAPTNYTIQQVSSPTTDEDLGNVTISDAATSTVLLNNTSTYNSLVGTLGTATGNAGSYASYLTFVTVPMVAGATYNFSLSSLQGATAYGNSMAIYIDFNRDGDFADAGEGVYIAAATTSGAHVETGSFTVPLTANNGLTRMRVICNEGLITSPTMSISYGEREEYMVNITSSNNGGGGNIPSFTYVWSDGTNLLGTTNPLSTAVTAATTYTVTGTTSAGCTASTSVAASVIALPTAPTATNSVQCGPGIPTASVASTTGLASPQFRWYDVATGGTALQSNTSATYQSSISTTTTFYVSEFDGTCESERTAVTVTVNTPPSITNSGPATICGGQSTTMFVLSSNPGYAYTWSGAAGTGGTVTVSPLSTTTYTVTALDTTTGEANSGCNTSSTLTITVNQSPVAVSITSSPSPAAVCQGSSINLSATGGTISGLTAPTGLGTNALVNSATGYPAPFSNYYGGNKTQILLTQSELAAQGIVNGVQINALYFAVYTTGTTASLPNFLVSLKNTSVTALSSTAFETGLTQVAAVPSLTLPTAVPVWYGVLFNGFAYTGGNLLIETSFSTNDGGSTAGCQTFMTAQSTTLCTYYRVDNTTAANVLAATTPTLASVNRPDVRLGYVQDPVWSWSPVTGSSAGIIVSPSVTTTYTATATQPNGCTASGSTSVTVNPVPSISATSTDIACFGESTGSISASGSGGTAPLTFALNGTNSNSTGSYSNLAAGVYTVSTTDANGCSATTSRTLTQPASACTVTATPTDVTCFGGSDGALAFSASGGVAPYSYTLNGTVATSPVTGLAAGSYVVVATDANSCTSSFTATVGQPAAAVTGTVSTTNVSCNGGSNGAATVTPAGGTGTLGILWSSGETTATISGKSAGSYVATITDANGCIGSATATITEPAVLAVTATPLSATVCGAAATTSVTVAATGGTAPYTGEGSFTQGAGTTSYSVTDANGCSASASASVTALSYTITATAGTNGTISPAGVTSVDCGTTQSYTITPDAGYQIDVLTVDGAPVTPSLTYNFINVTANRTIDVTFTVSTCSTVPTATAPAISSICSNDAYTLAGTIGGAATSGTWSSSGTGTFDNTSFASGTTYTPSAADIAAGTVTLTLTTDDPDGAGSCVAATASTVVTINLSPVVSISGATSYCAGGSTTLTAAGALSYVWSTSATSESVVANAGSYSVIGTAANGCTASAAVTVVENALPSTPVITASGATTFCAGGSVTLTSSYTGGNAWSNGATTDDITVSTSGSYTVTHTDVNGCSATSAATAVIVNTASASIAGNLGICTGGSTTLTASATPGAASYAWSLDGTPTLDVTASITAAVTGTYQVTTVDSNGCSATASAVVVDGSFPVTITPTCSTGWVVGNVNDLQVSPTGAGYTYLWSPGGSTSSLLSTTTANTYTVTVTNSFGCTGTASYVQAGSPLNGSYTIGATGCGSFSTLASAIAHLSAFGVSGNVTLDVPAGYTETAPAGGFQLNMCGLAAGLQSGPAQTITIQKSGSGANPALTANVGTSTTVDGIFVITGTDNVTIDGIDVYESTANRATAATATTRMEWGYAVLKCSGDDGANDVTIRNSRVSLTKSYVSNNGIYVANHNNLSTTGFTNSTYATTAQASRNKATIVNNTIDSCYTGIRLGANPNVVAATGECLNDTLMNISNNTIAFFGGSSTSASAIRYANNRGVTIRGNTISSNTTATTTTSYGIYAESGTWATISANTIQNIVTSSTFYGIFHALTGGDATNPNIVSVDSNIIQNCTPTAGSFYGIYSSSGTGGAGAIINSRNNVFRNHTWSATSTATMYGFWQFTSSGTGTTHTFNYTNNIVSDNVLQNTNTFYGIYGGSSNGTCNLNNNTIRNNRLSPSSGTTYLLYPGSSATLNVNNNNVTNNRKVVASTATSVGTTYMAYFIGGSSVNPGSFNNNVFDTLQITGVPGTATSLTYGMYVSNNAVAGTTYNNNIIRNITVQGTSTGNQTIYGSNFLLSGPGNIVKGNRIARIGITSNTNSTGVIATDAQFGGAMNGFVVGAQLAGSTTAGNNKFFDGNTINSIFAGGSNGIARGIWVTTGQEWHVYNNAISRISSPFGSPATAPTASSSTTVTTGLAVYGIDIANATATNNYFVYNNTVLLTGTGGGANFATSGIHANTTPNVTLVNNLVINNTTSGSSQAAVAYRRSSATLTSYNSASDNNLLYAGTPGPTRLIYGEGVGATTNSKQTLADFKTFVAPRDANSRTENTTFTAATTDSLLHVSTTVATFVESGGKPYPATALTTDIDGQTRSTTAPDIGADEDNFLGLLPQIASVSASPATGQCTAVDHTVTVVVGSNVTVTGVALNYSLNGTAQTPIAMSNGGSGTTWTGVIPASGSSIVTFSVTATDGTNSVSSNGTGYQDAYLSASSLSAVVTPTAICAGSSLNLNSYLSSTAPAPTTYGAANATNPADEEIFNVTFKTLNQTSACGTIAPGAGSVSSQYSNYTGVTAPLVLAGEVVSFSVQVGTCGGNYGNRSVIYIDWNRDGDFVDAGEQFAEPASVTGPHIWSGTITVPSVVSPGFTRMRVINNETTSITPPVGTFSWGEVEDYTIQLGSAAGFTFSWSDGTSVIATANGAYTPAAAGSYSYTVTGTDANGCTVVSSPVAVTVNPVPATPTATNSTQCGLATPACSVTGSGAVGNSFRWYLDATGGTALSGQTGSTLVNYPISATDTFYVVEINDASGCESPRVAVEAIVNTPVAVTATISSASVCPNTTVTLNANTSGPNDYIFTWFRTPYGANGFATGSPVDDLLLQPGTYTYSVNAVDAAAGCVTSSTVNVTVVPPPSITAVSADPTSACAGSTITLTGTTTVIGAGPQTGPTGYPASNATSPDDEEILNVTFGTLSQSSICGTLAPGAGSVAYQYSNYTGVAAPTVTVGQAVSFSVQIGTCGGNYTNRTAIYIDWNRDGDFLDANELAANEAAAVAGPHIWTGTISVPSASVAVAGITRMRVVNIETSAIPASNTTYSWGETEDYHINVLSESQGAGTYTWAWTDGTSPVGATNVVTANPMVTTTYTVTATDPATGCTNSGTVPVNIIPVPVAPTATNSSQCGARVPDCSVTGDGTTGATFNWYTTSTGGTPIAGETGSTLTAYIVSSTTTLYVAQVNPGTPSCEGPRATVTIDVAQPDPIAITASAGPYCLNGTLTLSVANTATTPSNTYTYTWQASSTAAGLTSTSGSGVSATPTAVGTYSYTVTAVDGQCSNVAIETVTYNPNPAIDSISVLPAGDVCAGSAITLNAFTVGAGPQVLPTGYCTGSPSTVTFGDEQIFGVSFASMSNLTQGETCGSNYADYTSSIPAPTVTVGASYPFSVVTDECDGPTYYSNGLSIFIDWNRDGDFADAGEQAYTTTATTIAPNTRTGTITVPSTASAGLTRMRVVVQESVASPIACPTFSYGEMEDYAINILALSNGGNTWTWEPGTLSGNQVTANPTATTTYTVTATTAAGCTSTGTVSKTVIPLPSAPTATDNTICGLNAANVSVTSTTGAVSPVFQWYLDATGGAPISGQSGASLSSYLLSSTDTFYVSETDGTCSSARTMVVQNVTQPDAVTAAASPLSFCLPGVPVNLSATQVGTTNNYTYSWTAVPPVGSGLSGVQMGPVTTLFSNDFSSSTLPANVTVSGTATITNGVLQINSNTTSQSGAVQITAGGNAADTISVEFDLIVPQNGADGISYSYCDDGVLTGGALNNESGTGSKLAISFDSYVNGSNSAGIYVMYPPVNQPVPGASNVLAYSSDVSWRASATPVRVAYTIGSTGLLNLSLNGTPVLTDVQLPAGYISANKNNWSHFFKARTGGVSEEHSIDNMTVRVAQIQSTPTPGQNLTVTPTAAGTYTYYVTATDGACTTQSSVSVVAIPPAAPISAGADVSLCDGGSVTLSASSAGLIPALRITESLWQVNAGTGPTGAGIPAWCSSWYTVNGGTTADMLEITNLGAGPATSAGVSIEFWNAASTTSGLPLYSYTIPATASLMSPGGLLYFSHTGSTTVNDLTNNFFTNAQNLNNSSGTAGGWVLRKNGVIIDAMAVSGYTFPAASGVTSAEWSGSIPSNSGLSGSILIAPDNNTSSSWANTSAAQTASVGTLNAGLVANLPSLGTVAWSSIPAGFTGTQATSTFGPITQPTSFVVMFDNGSCQSYDTVLVTPVTTPDAPVISSNRDSICVSGTAIYSSSGVTQGSSLMWQYYNTTTGTWTNTDSTRSSYNTPVIAPVLGDSIIYVRLASFCGTNPTYSNVDTLQIAKPFISSVVNDTVCGIGQLDLAVVGNGTMNWYQTSNSTTIVNTGNTYSVNTLNNVVYWVRASVGTCLDPAGRQPVFGIVNPAPAITTSPNVTLCENLSTTMTVSSPADTNGYYTYTWNPGGVTGNSYTVTPAATTDYTVVATSATGCGNYAVVTVTVNARPIIQTATASSSTVCQGDTIQLGVTLGNVNGPQTAPTGYCAGGGSTTTADEQIFSVSFGSMTNTQTETCSNNNSDYTSTIAPITVVAGLPVSWSVTVDECDGPTYYSSGLSIYIDYNRDGDWDDAGEQAYTSNATTIAPVTRSGNITIPLTASLGVTRMRVVAIESVTAPTACATFSYGEVEDYLVNIIGNSGTTVWTPGNLTGQTVSVIPAATTTYTATVTAGNGCTQTATVPVTVLPFTRPTITTSGSTSLCTPETVTLDAGVGYDSYSWSDGITQVATTQTYTTGTGGNYTVTVANLNGCSASVSQAVTVFNFTQPVISASLGTICTGAQTSTLSLTSSYASYLWSNGETTPSITVGATGVYSVTVTSADGCTGSASFTLTGSPAPATPTIDDADVINYCFDGITPGSYLLFATTNGESVSWNDPGGSTDDYVFLNVGNGPGEYGVGSYPIIITATGTGGCVASDTVTFNVIATTSSTSTVAACNSYDWNGTTYTASGTYTYTMIGGNAQGCDSTATLVLTINTPTSSSETVAACDSYTWNGTAYTASGTYTWSGTNSNGCDSTATLDLTINTPTSSTTTQTACDTYTWNGTTYTQSGTYTWTGVNAANCDSVATLVLTINTGCSGVTLNLEMFLQGYVDPFATTPAMLPVLANQLVAGALGTETDTVTITLYDAINTATVIDSAKGILMTDGSVSVTLPAATPGTSYWIGVKHRNSLETWSAVTVTFASVTSYDFTSSIAQAYSIGLDPMVEIGTTGVYAIWTGDLNQDDFIDASDFSIYDADNSAGLLLDYYATDMNGDGFVDASDFTIYDFSNSVGPFFIQP